MTLRLVGYTNRHWFGTSQKEVETKGTNNLSKAGSQYGVFSSLFYFIIMVNVGSIPIMIA